ncbi:MAG: Gfo/Idh/MocA family oxidoreductase, partial [Pseudomonadota bacterium]|nr:Gfo/Idh/MocA family oxidoreductase [Pseudomonadota bacterium]
GIVGLGYLGKFHLEKFQKNRDCQLVWLIDKNIENIKKYKDKYKISTNYKEIDDDIDAVSIVTPTVNHYEIARYFIEKNKHVLIEKPMTQTVSEAKKLINLAKKHKKTIQIGHLERFNPVIRKVSSLIKNPLFIEVHRLAQFNPRSTDVNVVYDLMIHDIDITTSLVPSKIKKISSFGKSIITNKIDIANARLEFFNGTIANLTASRISQKSERKIRIFEKDKYLSLDFLQPKLKIVEKVKKKSSKLFKTLEYNYKKTDALNDEIIDFINSIRMNKKPLVDGIQGMEALKLAAAISKKL